MDKQRSLLNISASIVSHIILLVSAIFVRRLLIQYIGNEANGLNSLYTNIIGMLEVVELGIGRAIIFSMYKPIIEQSNCSVAALYWLYKKVYLIIGAVVLLAGLCVIPFLPKLIGDYKLLTIHAELPYLLALISVALSYLYSAKTALIEAHKDNYVTTAILTVSHLLRFALQIISILVFQSFIIFLLCQIIGTAVVWLLTEIVVRKRYKGIVEKKEEVDDETRHEVIKNVKAMCMHKVGTVMVKTVDSLIISGFLGVVVLGMYSNYTHMAEVVTGLIALFFTPLTSVVGHLCAGKNNAEKQKWFGRFYYLNFVLGFVFFLGYFAVVDEMIEILFGPGLHMSRSIAFIITLNQFTQYMRNSLLLFRNASGTFYYDRWKPITEGVVNLILSLLFVIIFPKEYKVVGVIVATILTTLIICNVVEPYVVFHHVFRKSPKEFYIRNYAYIAIFVGCLFIMDALMQNYNSQIKCLLINGFISIGISLTVLCFLSLIDRDLRYETGLMIRKTIALIMQKKI